MKFSPDTSRLVEGRWYWYFADGMVGAQRVRYTTDIRERAYLWGDECPPPEVEVEPSRPAWEPPVCPAGQARLYTGGICLAQHDEVLDAHQYPKPAWPPRIGEIVEVLWAGQWIQGMVTSGPRVRPGGTIAFVECSMWTLGQDEEGKTWRWVYRDLSDYTPPGGAK